MDCVYETAPLETHNQSLKRKYDALAEGNNVNEELIRIFRSKPIEEATNILSRLRAGPSIETLVQHVKSGELLLQLSVRPQTQYRYSVGNILDIPHILRPESNPYIGSTVYKMKYESVGELSAHGSSYQAMCDAPYHTVQMVDFSIDNAMPSKWTAVSSDDRFLRGLLRSYFAYSYIFIPFLHKDYFLRDLGSGSRRFRSSLLVNCVLAAGCVRRPSPRNICLYRPC